MAIAQIVGGIVKGLISPLTEGIKGIRERKKMMLEIAHAETAARIRRLQSSQDGDIAWETKSIDNAGWKDEYWTVVISLPFIMGFFGPVPAGWVTDGFVAFSNCPEWYQWAVSIAIGSSFGVKEFTKFMKVKKGTN